MLPLFIFIIVFIDVAIVVVAAVAVIVIAILQSADSLTTVPSHTNRQMVISAFTVS